MANIMLRVEYNLKGDSCKIKAFKELRGRRKQIKDVATCYRFSLKWSVRSAYESGTVFTLRYKEIKQSTTLCYP